MNPVKKSGHFGNGRCAAIFRQRCVCNYWSRSLPNSRRATDTTSPMGQDLRVLDGIASWCGALHGSMPLSEALEALAKAISADIGILSRDARSDGKPRVVADYDISKSDRHIDHTRRAFAPDVLGA